MRPKTRGNPTSETFGLQNSQVFAASDTNCFPHRSVTIKEMASAAPIHSKSILEAESSTSGSQGSGALEASCRENPGRDFKSEPRLHYIHRRLGNTDIYSIANDKPFPVPAHCNFRVTGKQPELWDPAIGHIEPAAARNKQGTVTSLPLRLGPSGSV